MKIVICKSCGETKQTVGRGLCKKCYQKEYRLKHRNKILTQKRKYRSENRTELNKKFKEYYHNGKSNTIKICNTNEKLYWRCGNGSMIFGSETHKSCPVCHAWDEETRRNVCLTKENAYDERGHESIILICHNCGYIQEKEKP